LNFIHFVFISWNHGFLLIKFSLILWSTFYFFREATDLFFIRFIFCFDKLCSSFLKL
jgi:hypothetical protein